ncbi:sensor domain-containing diguanylate cyclase [Salipaludibacillus daqingensis]|uniref:sensor domain-containing diguanylate cyclase n=1 Tax=Salipaludibacillus daqingensis TaxID=3041001 RepID=UPI002476AB5A|nr:sensor domain-containing diguanylate cyclase [Salipaludibacillus daqingensis]
MSDGQKQLTWVLWIVTFPPILYFIFERTYLIWETSWPTIISFMILIVVASLFPIQIKQTSLIPLHGISLAIFLHFGLLIEAVLSQVAIAATLSSLKLSKQESYRFPLNSLIFLLTSFGAGAMFFVFGGQVGDVTIDRLFDLWLPILIYFCTFIILNSGLIYILRALVLKIRNINYFDEALMWQLVMGIVVLPLGLSLAVLVEEVGYTSILLAGIPIIAVSLILRLNNDAKKTTGLLKLASKFGYEVNDRLNVDEIIELFVHKCKDVFPARGFYLFERTGEESLKPIYTFDESGVTDWKVYQGDGISNFVLKNKESVVYHSQKQWRHLDVDKIYDNVHSIISAPYIRNNKVMAVVTITSERKYAFEKSHQILLEIMTNYLTVALQNARYLEKTKEKSERCALTNLYNFKYFENILLEDFDPPTRYDKFAIILLDLDHFKKINDTYGHQSGNDVLIQVAAVLNDNVGSTGVTARYGGEEFVVLLRETTMSEAYEMAEKLRYAIEKQEFVVNNDLNNGEKKIVQITASIGVAMKLEEDESPISVLRNADRAMYTGAKQKGRNKVAQLI